MKIIFLDVDGVLNNCHTTDKVPYEDYRYDGVDYDKIIRLRKIVEATGAKIVLSSTWRLYPDFKKYLLLRMGEKLASSVIGQTPEFIGGSRRKEIDAWLLAKEPTIEKFIVIDDLTMDELEEYGENFVQTSDQIGLTDEHVNQCISLLQ